MRRQQNAGTKYLSPLLILIYFSWYFLRRVMVWPAGRCAVCGSCARKNIAEQRCFRCRVLSFLCSGARYVLFWFVCFIVHTRWLVIFHTGGGVERGGGVLNFACFFSMRGPPRVPFLRSPAARVLCFVISGSHLEASVIEREALFWGLRP